MHSDRPSLLMLTSSFPRGPSDETCGYIRDFARSLSREFSVRVLAPPEVLNEEWPDDVFTVERSRPLLRTLDPFQGSRDLNDWSSRSHLANLVLMLSLLSFSLKALTLARRADVICSHWIVPCGLIGSLLSRVLKKPHIIVEHSGGVHLLSRMRSGRWLTRFIIGGAESVVVVSSDLRRRLIELSPEAREKVEVMPMGITAGHGDAEAAGKSREERSAIRRMVLFVGRLVEVKGVEVLLRASDGEAWQVVIAGEGERRGYLQDLAGTLGVDALFVGQVNSGDRERLFAMADVVVVPSVVLRDGRTEGMPVACLEAMAAARPVIASRVGGLPEIIADADNGLLIEPGNHHMLRERLKLLLNDQSLQRELGLNARRTAERFDWAQAGARFAGIINESLRKNDQNIDARRLRAESAQK